MKGIIRAAALLAAILSTTITAQAATIFEDNFDGAAGAVPDVAKWYVESNCHGSGASEIQVYTRSNKNAGMTGAGQLRIAALKESTTCDSNGDGKAEPFNYTSARIQTVDRVIKAGRVLDARIKVKRQFGVGPALWGGLWGGNFLWPRDGEWDVEFNPTCISLGIIGANPSNPNQDWPMARCDAAPWDAAGDNQYHDYKVEFHPDRLAFYFDGTKRFEAKQSDYAGGWPFAANSYPVILNVAVGGNRPWGAPTAATVFPSEMFIDSIRVSDLTTTTPPTTPPPTTPPTEPPPADDHPDTIALITPASASKLPTSWKKDGTSIYSYVPAEACWTIDTLATEAELLIDARNQNAGTSGLPSGYAFNVNVKIDGKAAGAVTIPGNTQATETGHLPVALSSGRHELCAAWTNDAYASGQYDANIRIDGMALVGTSTEPNPPPESASARARMKLTSPTWTALTEDEAAAVVNP